MSAMTSQMMPLTAFQNQQTRGMDVKECKSGYARTNLGKIDCPFKHRSFSAHHACRAVNEGTPSKESSSHAATSDAIEELLKTDPKTYDRIERVRKAAQTVAGLQAQKAELDRAERDHNYAEAWQSQDLEKDQAQRASERGARAEVLSAAEEFEQAQAELKAAVGDMSKWSSLVDEDAEKLESGKAGAIGGVGALAGSIPLLLGTQIDFPSSITHLGVTLVTGLLFGVTYRYAIRQDLNNKQLKGGVLGAFGLVRGLALAEQITTENGFNIDSIGHAALSCGQSVIIVGFAALAIELAFQRQLLKPFGSASAQ